MIQENNRFTNEELIRILSLSHHATAIYKSEDICIAYANDAMLQFWSKDNRVIGMKLEEALPELQGQPFVGLLKNVWRTGQTLDAANAKANLMVDGVMQVRYFDFIYRALKNEKGETYCILHTANDVTERYLNSLQIKAGQQREKELNKELFDINEELRQANDELAMLNEQLMTALENMQQSQTTLRETIDSASMGTWLLESETGKLILSDRAYMIYGLPQEADINLPEVMGMIVDEDRQRIQDSIQRTIQMNQSFEEDFCINPANGSTQRWLRANGKAHLGKDGKLIHVSGTLQDITERKLDDIRKNDFIAMVSHELKTPLTSLKAFIQLLGLNITKEKDPVLTGILSKADIQADKMTTLINSFLNVSRLDTGKIHLHKTDCFLDELVVNTLEEIRVVSQSHKITFIPCEPLPVHADCDKISQVITNLISNAIKYSPVGSNILIECLKKGNLAQVSVKDEGMGIDPADMTNLFKRFYRVVGQHNQTVSGFGIGLYLCAEIIRGHDGNIWVESEPGKGSHFHFNIPISA